MQIVRVFTKREKNNQKALIWACDAKGETLCERKLEANTSSIVTGHRVLNAQLQVESFLTEVGFRHNTHLDIWIKQ